MPVNVLIIRAMLNFYLYYGDNFKIECPTGSGKLMNLFEVSKEIAGRLTRIFLRDEQADGLSTAERKSSRAIPFGATTFSSMNTSMATLAPGWAPIIRRAGPDSLPNSSNFTASSMPSECWNWAERPRSLRKAMLLDRRDRGQDVCVGNTNIFECTHCEPCHVRRSKRTVSDHHSRNDPA